MRHSFIYAFAWGFLPARRLVIPGLGSPVLVDLRAGNKRARLRSRKMGRAVQRQSNAQARNGALHPHPGNTSDLRPSSVDGSTGQTYDQRADGKDG